MKILFVNTLYAPLRTGGAEVSVQTMAEGFAASGNQVYILTLGYKQSVRKLNGVIVITIKTKNLYHIEEAENQPYFRKMIWHLLDSCNPFYKQVINNLLDRIHPDVVNTNNIQGFSPYLWKLIKKRNIKLVHTLRDYYLMCHVTTMYTKCGDCQQLCMGCKLTSTIKKKYYKLPDGYIGISKFILDQHNRFNIGSGQPTAVIANGVADRTNAGRWVKTPKREVVFGFIGKANQQKGVDYLLAELAKIPADLPFKLVIAGKPDPGFEKTMNALYKGKLNYEFIGKTDASAFYQRIDVVIVPSNWNEPFGRIPIEAVAALTPVCIAYKAGLKELYNEAQMWRFNMEINSLSELVKSILRDPMQIRRKSEACKQPLINYAPEALNQQLSDFINLIPNE
jgi:glycosyltransferase involved in cell wall biosynthesis